MRIRTERAELITEHIPPHCVDQHCNEYVDLALDLVEARKLLREIASMLSAENSAIARRANLLILAHFLEEA